MCSNTEMGYGFRSHDFTTFTFLAFFSSCSYIYESAEYVVFIHKSLVIASKVLSKQITMIRGMHCQICHWFVACSCRKGPLQLYIRNVSIDIRYPFVRNLHYTVTITFNWSRGVTCDPVDQILTSAGSKFRPNWKRMTVCDNL